jgi:hypothetical protein
MYVKEKTVSVQIHLDEHFLKIDKFLGMFEE